MIVCADGSPQPSPSRSGRPRNPRGKGGRLREELVEAATRLMSAGGHENQVSVRGVTREAGVSPQSFYLHFDKIDELLWEVYAREYGILTAELAAAADEHDEPRARLLALCLSYCQFAGERPASYLLMFSLTGRTAHDWGGKLPGAPSTRLLLKTVTACRPKANTSANAQTASLIWAGLHGLVSLRRDRPVYAWAPLERLVTELIDGLLPRRE